MSLHFIHQRAISLSPIVQAPLGAQYQLDERSLVPSSALHPVGGDNTYFLQSLHEARRSRRKVEVSARIIHPCPRSEPEATCLQEASASNLLTKHAPSPPADREIRSAQAPHQRSLQYHQGPTPGSDV